MPDGNSDNDDEDSPPFEEAHEREQPRKRRVATHSHSKSTRALPVCLLVGVLLTSGCGDQLFSHTEPSSGVLGVAEFSWEETGFGCLFGCNAKASVAAGATATLRVENDNALPPYTVRSDDPSVARVSGTRLIEVEALRAGEAYIILEELSGGALIDEFVITVADVHRITAGRGLLIAVGGSTEIEPSMFDNTNRKIVGLGGLAYAPSPSLDQGQLGLSTNCESFLFRRYEECVVVSARNVGIGFLEIEADSGATLGLALDLVIDDDVVTSVRLETDRFDNRIIVTPIASASGTRVFGARCRWSLTPSTSSLYIADVEDGSAEIRSRRFNTTSTGTLVCDIGSASRSIALRL